MKHLIFIISLIALVVWNLACTKESLETQNKEDCTGKTVVIEWNEGSKFGANPIWFETSNSMDNALAGQPRKHTIFNQDKIQYQKFTPTGEDAFSYLGVFHWPYIMEVVFDNDSIGVHKVSVAYVNGNEFTHYPNMADNLLKDDHPAYMVTYESIGKTIKYTNGKRNQPINLRGVELAYDGVPIEVQFNTPMTRLTNTPDYGHKY
jgi:hypothetical protein